ncbi:hypothetical protein DMENIID0001_141040 [Sergentomyia squamirostris]
MNSPASTDPKNSPTVNDFAAIVPLAQFAPQNFLSMTPPSLQPMTPPLSITLPLCYRPAVLDNLNPERNVRGDGLSGNGTIPRRKTPGSEITMTQFTRTALKGCEIAEKIVRNHKNRPCFKKIDSLCARLKQDLVRPDRVLANINSQGIAWAVKDMIFTFTRILNAWIIVKGYMYETPPGLRKVKQSCSGGFDESFLKWQEATLDFLEHLTETFESLDSLVQTQRNKLASSGRKEDKEYSRNRSSEASSDDVKDDSFEEELASMKFFNNFHADTKTETSPDGGYIRTGIYNTLQANNTTSQHVHPVILPQLWEKSVFQQKEPAEQVSFSFLSNKYGSDQANPQDTLILILLSKLYEMKDASLFFNKHFTKNYVPEFVASGFNCKDMKTIMVSIEKKLYQNVPEIVNDIAAILTEVKIFLKKRPDNSFLAENALAFEIELKNLLSDDIFSMYRFDHIF